MFDSYILESSRECILGEILSKKKHMYVRIGLIKLLSRIILVILVTLIVNHFITKNPLVNKQKTSNSLELLQGPITEIQKKYGIK